MEETKGLANKWLTLLAVAVGTFLCGLDATITSISFPRLAEFFETEPSVVLWVTVAFLLVCSALMLTAGRVGDLFGRKKVYVLGLVVFTVGLILCSLSQSILQLILYRVVQAAGAATIIGLGPAIVTAVFPDRERGKALGILTAILSAGALVGPVLGGVLLDNLDWSSVFYIRVPAGIIAIVMAWAFLKEQRASNINSKFDIWGGIILFGCLSCLLLFINLGGKSSFVSAPVLLLISGAIVLLVLFVVQERRTGQPLVDLSLFKSRSFTVDNISIGIMAFSLSAYMFLIPFYLMNGVGYSTSESGLLFLSFPSSMAVVTPLSGWLSDRVGTRLLPTVGMALICLSLFLCSRLGSESSGADIVLSFVIFGIGAGLFMPPNQSLIMGAAPKDRLGSVSALMATIRQIAFSSGTAITGAIFTRRQSFHAIQLARENLDLLIIDRLSLISGFQDTFLVTAIVCSIGIFTSLIGAKKQTAR
ncbi:MAG: MFS transporter [Promethearchaeota archaeon]